MKLRATLFSVLLSLAISGSLCAQDAGLALLTNPSGLSPLGFAPKVDGVILDTAAPQILIYKSTPEADFVSAVWKDASGKMAYQRDVFVMKPDYTIVVDYIYNKAAQDVVRTFTFPAGTQSADSTGGQVTLGDGKWMRVQPLDHAGITLNQRTLTLDSKVKAPVPLTTVLLNGAVGNAPQVEYIQPANPMIVKLKITFPNQRMDEIALSWEPRPLHFDGTEYHGWAVSVHHSPAGVSFTEIE